MMTSQGFDDCKGHCCICGEYCRKKGFELDDNRHVVCDTSHQIEGRCKHCKESLFNLKIRNKNLQWKAYLLRCTEKKETCQTHRCVALAQAMKCDHFLCSRCLSGMLCTHEMIPRCSVTDCYTEFQPEIIKSFLNRIDGVLKKEMSIISMESGDDLCSLCKQRNSHVYLKCTHSLCKLCLHQMLNKEHLYLLPLDNKCREVMFCPELKCLTWYLLDDAKLLLTRSTNTSMTDPDDEKLYQNPSFRSKINTSVTEPDDGKLCQNPSCRSKASIELSCTHWMCTNCGNNVAECKMNNDTIITVKCLVKECGVYTDLEYFQREDCYGRNKRHNPISKTGLDEQQTMETKGVKNIGMICYGSSILQVLAQTPVLLPQLQLYKDRNTLVLGQLYEILEDINKADTKASKTVSSQKIELFMDIIYTMDRSFQEYVQNDSHSFLMTLFSLIDEELKESYNSQSTTECQESTNPGPLALFEGKFQMTFTYSGCHHKDTPCQMFRSLYIPLISQDCSNLYSVEEGILWFMREETFEKNQIPCRICDASDNVTKKKMKFGKFPDILIIQIGRAEEKLITRREEYVTLTKRTDRIQYPMELSIPARLADEDIKHDSLYNLFGVVMHTGNMRGGHYDACVRNNYTRRWLYCNDSFVTTYDEQEVEHIPNAYLLFYAKR